MRRPPRCTIPRRRDEPRTWSMRRRCFGTFEHVESSGEPGTARRSSGDHHHHHHDESFPPPSFPTLTARSSLRYFIFQNIHVTSAPLAQLSDVDFGTRQSLVQRRIFHPNLDVKNRKMRGRLKRNGPVHARNVVKSKGANRQKSERNSIQKLNASNRLG